MRHRFAVVAAFAAACSMRPPVVITSVPPPSGNAEAVQNRMTVEGHARLDIQPDRLDLMVTLSSENPRADRAVADVRRRQKAFLQAIGPLELPSEDVTLGLVALEAVYDYPPHAAPRLRGYVATIDMVATLRDFDRIGELMQHAADSGAARLYTRFRSTELTKRKVAVRELALKAARDKAEQMARALGAKLGPVVSVQESATGQPAWPTSSVANEYAEVKSLEQPIQAETQELSVYVQVAYRLET